MTDASIGTTIRRDRFAPDGYHPIPDGYRELGAGFAGRIHEALGCERSS